MIYLYEVFSKGSHLCNYTIFRIKFDYFFTFQPPAQYSEILVAQSHGRKSGTLLEAEKNR